MFKKQFAYVADLAPISIEKCLLKSKKGLEAKRFFLKLFLIGLNVSFHKKINFMNKMSLKF